MRGVVRAASIALTVAAAGVASPPPAAAAAAPSLRVLDDRPLVVTGRGFVPGERVVVTAVTSLGARIARVRATRAGRVTARLRLHGGPCGAAVAVRARGASGRSAAVAVAAAPPCVPPPRS
jgi:hypothetical protein